MNDPNSLTDCPKCHHRTLLTYTFPDRREVECLNPECGFTEIRRPLPRVEISFTLGKANEHPLCFGRATVTMGVR